MLDSRKLIQKQNRHVRLLSANTPPRVGPTTDEIAYVLDKIAVKMAIFSVGTRYAMTFMDPDAMPAQPHPCIARPTMSEVELGARAQRMDPAPKRTTAPQKTSLRRTE